MGNRWKYLRRVITGYLAASLLSISLSTAHYHAFQKKRIEQDKTNTMLVQEFSFEVNDQTHLLTVVGETHRYKRVEAQYFGALSAEHDVILSEGVSIEYLQEQFPLANALVSLFHIGSEGLMVRSGRLFRPNLDREKTQYLEESPSAWFGALPPGEKKEFAYTSAIMFLAAPFTYWAGDEEERMYVSNPTKVLEHARFLYEGARTGRRHTHVAIRDSLMAQEAAKIMHLSPTDSTLGYVSRVGRGHFFGFVEELEQLIKLTPVSEVYIPGTVQ